MAIAFGGNGEATSSMPAASIANLATQQFLTGSNQERPVSDGLGGMAYVQAGCLNSTMSSRSNEIIVWDPRELDTPFDQENGAHATLLIGPRFELSTIETVQRLEVRVGNSLKLQ